jgi:ribosome-associated heat shock protein Hsp15
MQAGESTEPLRLDKWLWAARFFKTRSLAAEAVAGGKVQLNSLRAKPSRTVRIGDEITVRRGPYESTVVVRDLGKQRGPASQAQQLYKETEESKQARFNVRPDLRPKGALPRNPAVSSSALPAADAKYTTSSLPLGLGICCDVFAEPEQVVIFQC